MVDIGDTAPTFTAPLVGDETEPFSLSNALGTDPLVLAFFPAAFSTTCTAELCTLRDEISRFGELGASVFGISTDLPYALARFRDENDLPFGLISDNDGAIIAAYDVVDNWEHIALPAVAQRAVFVIDTEGQIGYAWRANNPSHEPEYDAVAEAVSRLW